MPQDKRKSKRHFSLEKPVERRFEIEKDDVESSGSVITPTTNGSTTQQPSGQGFTPSPNPNPDPTPPEGTNGKTKWIAAALAAGLIGGGTYLLWPSGDKDNPTSIDDNNQPKVAQVDVNGDGVVDINDDPAQDTNGDGVIDMYDAAKDTNGDGVVDAADAAVADSNGDGIIDEKDKSSGDMLFEKPFNPEVDQIAKVDVNGDGVVDVKDNPTTDTNGDGVINFYDAVKDTNGDGAIDAADAAVADSNGDGIIDAKDKSSGDIIKEKNSSKENSNIAGGKAKDNSQKENTLSSSSRSNDSSTPSEANSSSNLTTASNGKQSQSAKTAIQIDQSENNTGSIHELALRAIRGEFGNSPDRQRLLGDSYKKVQKEINRIYRERHYRQK